MKNVTKLTALAFAGMIALTACGKKEEPKKDAMKTEEKKDEKKDNMASAVLKGDELLKAQKEGALVIDVRKVEQYNEGHIKDSKNIPLADIEKEIANVAPDKAKKIVLYCNTGNQSGKAAEKLKAMGYTDVHNAEGVKQFNYELEKK